MRPLTLLLGVAVVASLLAVINSRYHARRLYAQVDQAERQVQRLEAQREALRVRRDGLAKSSRVNQIARDRLGLVPIPPDRVRVMPEPASVEWRPRGGRS